MGVALKGQHSRTESWAVSPRPSLRVTLAGRAWGSLLVLQFTLSPPFLSSVPCWLQSAQYPHNKLFCCFKNAGWLC